MLRSPHVAASLLVLVSSVLATAGGCHVIAGIEEKTLNGGGGSDAGSGGEGGGAVLECKVDPKPSLGCEMVQCPLPMGIENGCHCGACNRDCGMGLAGCLNGLCKPKLMVPSLGTNTRIYRAATNGKALYFPHFVDDTPKSKIRAVEFDGTLSPNHITEVDGYVKVIAADCERVYFATTRLDSASPPEAVWFVPISGGEAKPIPEDPAVSVSSVESIVVDKGTLYWTDSRGVGIWPIGSAAISRIDVSLGFYAVGLAIRGTDLYWSEAANISGGNGKIRYARVESGVAGSFETLADKAGEPRQIAVDDNYVYWIDAPTMSAHRIKKIERDPGGNPSIFDLYVTSEDGAGGYFELSESIAVDDAYVYFIDGVNGEPRTLRLRKNMPMTRDLMANEPFRENWLIADDHRLYLVSPSTAQIDWVAK